MTTSENPVRVQFEDWWGLKNGLIPEQLKESHWLAFCDGWHRCKRSSVPPASKDVMEAAKDHAGGVQSYGTILGERIYSEVQLREAFAAGQRSASVPVREHQAWCESLEIGRRGKSCNCGAIDSAGRPIPL